MKEEKETIRELIEKKYSIEWKNHLISWDIPNDIDADVSLNILSICKKLGKSIEKLGEEIINELEQRFPTWSFKLIDTGYINIKLSWDYYRKLLTYSFWENWNHKKKKKESVNIEFVSANPTGYLHLAHFRQAFYGDALANIYDFKGYKVTREYYINDKGKQMEDLVDSVYYHYQLLNKQLPEKEEEEILYPGLSSRQAANFLKKKWKIRFLNLSREDKGERLF